jgi:hypothetical protein
MGSIGPGDAEAGFGVDGWTGRIRGSRVGLGLVRGMPVGVNACVGQPKNGYELVCVYAMMPAWIETAWLLPWPIEGLLR